MDIGGKRFHQGRVHRIIIRIGNRVKVFALGRHPDFHGSADIVHADGDFIAGGMFQQGNKRFFGDQQGAGFLMQS